MRARAVVLRNENEGRFHQLCDELEAEWQLQTTTEMALLEKMAVAQWKLVRAEPARPSSATYTRTRSRRPCSNRSPNSRNASIAPSSAPSANSRNYRKSAAKRPRRPPKKPRPLLPSRDRQEAVPRLNRGTLWVRPLGPPPPPSDAPDLAYTMSAEPPTPAQPDSVTFRANGGIDT